MAEPMTPATFGPMACMSRKFAGLAFWPTIWETRAAIGTAETPAEPISGLTFLPDSLHMMLPPMRPPAVEMPNATRPRKMIFRVSAFRKLEATMVAPTEVERKIVTMFMRAFCTVSDRRSVQPHSRKRLPSIRQPISGAVDGRSRMTKMVTMIGKRIFSVLETGRDCTILILRSASEVMSFMIGGWIIGIRAM